MTVMTRVWLIALFTFAAATHATPAFADLTAFIGTTTTPNNRPVRGFAGGIGLLIVGFEFEYANTVEDDDAGAPSLNTGMGNVYAQTPFPVARMQFYATVGGGLYRERLGEIQETNVGVNLGGGVKVTLAGPLKLRVDYRIFRLQGEPLFENPKRLYAGVNLGF